MFMMSLRSGGARANARPPVNYVNGSDVLAGLELRRRAFLRAYGAEVFAGFERPLHLVLLGEVTRGAPAAETTTRRIADRLDDRGLRPAERVASGDEPAGRGTASDFADGAHSCSLKCL